MNKVKRKTISFEEVAYTNMINIEALVNILNRKKIVSKEEILQEIQLIRQQSKPN